MQFQIPNQRGLQPTLGPGRQRPDRLPQRRSEREPARGRRSTRSSAGSTRKERSTGRARCPAAIPACTSTPDWTGDLLYNGIAQNAFKDDTAFAWQTDGSYQLSDAHTLRAGFYLQHDSAQSNTTSQVLPIDATGAQTSDIPQTDRSTTARSRSRSRASICRTNGRRCQPLTINYGLRFDHYSAYSSGSQLSPRVNFVWKLDCRHHRARRLLALLHAAAVRADRQRDLHASSPARRRCPPGSDTLDTRRSPSAPTTTTSACSRSCSTTR